MKKNALFILVLWVTASTATGQLSKVDSVYEQAYSHIYNMLSGKEKLFFKKAVFITENAFLGNKLSFNDFETAIYSLLPLAKSWMNANLLLNYHEQDSVLVHKSGAIYALLKDTIILKFADGATKRHFPFTYDFDDFFAREDWTKTQTTGYWFWQLSFTALFKKEKYTNKKVQPITQFSKTPNAVKGEYERKFNNVIQDINSN